MSTNVSKQKRKELNNKLKVIYKYTTSTVRVAVDRMVEAHICDGDIVIFHPGLTEGSGIFVVSIGNTLVVKRVDLYPASRTIVLYSANPAREPRRFSGPALDDIRISRRVVAVYHRV
jgi:SOS-response transcriptional repressor LexA